MGTFKNGRYRPSKSEKRAFAIRMQDKDEKQAYEARKEAKAEKRRSTSQFNYSKAGGSYVPTKEQYIFVMNHDYTTSEEREAFDMVVYGYSCQEKISHDYIHIVNELRRKTI